MMKAVQLKRILDPDRLDANNWKLLRQQLLESGFTIRIWLETMRKLGENQDAM